MHEGLISYKNGMFALSIKIFSHNVQMHIYTLFEDKFTPCLMTCLHQVDGVFFYKMFKVIFIQNLVERDEKFKLVQNHPEGSKGPNMIKHPLEVFDLKLFCPLNFH